MSKASELLNTNSESTGSRFYGEMQGNRGEVTRTGTVKSGFLGHIRGWNIGVRVVCEVDGDQDLIKVYKTGGSNATTGQDKLITTLKGKG